jgi:frataxin-like iron-binding protein CyaY
MRRSKSSEHYTHKECKWCNKGGKKRFWQYLPAAGHQDLVLGYVCVN